jgi:uncharacterized membrane protein YbaN (DUF454 family)
MYVGTHVGVIFMKLSFLQKLLVTLPWHHFVFVPAKCWSQSCDHELQRRKNLQHNASSLERFESNFFLLGTL